MSALWLGSAACLPETRMHEGSPSPDAHRRARQTPGAH
jgi:hypothetical protein